MIRPALPLCRFLSCAFLCALVSGAISQETQRVYLSGRGKDDTVPWKFFCTSGSQSGFWTNIPVPSNWELQGFGTLNYGRDLPGAADEQGQYEHPFIVPANWIGHRVFLVFDGAMTDTQAKVNGRIAGPLHQGGFYRFKYEITSFVHPGSNFLEVAVNKHSANESVNRAERQSDYWVFGGIFRPVWIEIVPQQFIERTAIDAQANGAFAVDVFVNTAALTNADPSAALEVQILDLNGQPIGSPFSAKLGNEKTSLRAQFASPRQWTAETPNLYRAEIRLKHGETVLHRVDQRFGFRTFEVREGDGFYLNGQRIVLKGVCRHSFWPDSGRTLSEAVHRMDIEAIKDMNMNAVRMSHYPPDEQFLDLCDELGVYVLDELGGWQKSYDAEVGHKLVEEMVVRDVNHPSILFWDNGNEGGWNTQLDGDYAKWDPQHRRVLHPWDTFSGVNTTHYLDYTRTAQASEGRPMFRNTNRGTDPATNTTAAIFMPTEFLHGLYDGGLGAGFEDYWNVMGKSKFIGGGFFWALIDEGVKRPDNGKIDVVGNAAPDGILGPYREREGSFYAIKEIWSPIIVRGLTNGVVTIENHFSFTDANQCTFTAEFRRFRTPNEPGAGFTVVGGGKLTAPSIPPGASGTLRLPSPGNSDSSDEIALQVLDRGRELWTWTWPQPAANRFRQLMTSSPPNKVVASETAESVTIKSGDLTVRFSKQTGMLDGVQRGAQSFSITNGPRPAVGVAALTNFQSIADGPDHIVRAQFDGALSSVVWRVRSNGWLQCDYAYSASGTQNVVGVAFDYPENLVKGKRWLGNGPYRVWKNRMGGGTFGVWQTSYNNTITGWRDWVYPEFKGIFSDVHWMQLDTAEGTITAIPGDDHAFVQVLAPEYPPSNQVANTVMALPHAGLAFLNAIPPIGNKFRIARDGGLQGQPNIAVGQYSGSVSFYFGALP